MQTEMRDSSGPFGQLAVKLLELGLSPVPTGGDDGKRPLLRGYNRGIVNFSNITEFQRRYGHANCAILCGTSGIAVVDVDDPSLLADMLARFGDTPLQVRTGRGGYQLYYRANSDVRPKNLRSSDGIAVEIKAGSSIVVVPPSKNLETGNSYAFVKGGLDADTLRQLPIFRSQAVHAGNSQSRSIEKGRRNNALWGLCMSHAESMDSLEDLIDFAETRNEECLPSLEAAEVCSIAKSAWRYTISGKNLFKKGGAVVYSKTEVKKLARLFPGNAVVLLMKLCLEHGARVKRGETFAIATAAMARDGCLPGWNRSRYRKAVAELLNAKLLVVVQGSSGHRPTQYTFAAC